VGKFPCFQGIISTVQFPRRLLTLLHITICGSERKKPTLKWIYSKVRPYISHHGANIDSDKGKLLRWYKASKFYLFI